MTRTLSLHMIVTSSRARCCCEGLPQLVRAQSSTLLEQHASSSPGPNRKQRIQRLVRQHIGKLKAQEVCAKLRGIRILEAVERSCRHHIGGEEHLAAVDVARNVTGAVESEENFKMHLTYSIEMALLEESFRNRIAASENSSFDSICRANDKLLMRIVIQPLTPEHPAFNVKARKKSGYFAVRINTEGMTLADTARRHGTTVEEIIELNEGMQKCGSDFSIPVRSVIRIPRSAQPNVGATGATLRDFAAKHGVIVDFLRKHNPQLALVGELEMLPLSTEILIPTISTMQTPEPSAMQRKVTGSQPIESVPAEHELSFLQDIRHVDSAAFTKQELTLPEKQSAQLLEGYMDEFRLLTREAEASCLVLHAMMALEAPLISSKRSNLASKEERERAVIAAHEAESTDAIRRLEVQKRNILLTTEETSRQNSEVRHPCAPEYTVSRAHFRRKWKELKVADTDTTSAHLAALLDRFDAGRQISHVHNSPLKQ